MTSVTFTPKNIDNLTLTSQPITIFQGFTFQTKEKFNSIIQRMESFFKIAKNSVEAELIFRDCFFNLEEYKEILNLSKETEHLIFEGCSPSNDAAIDELLKSIKGSRIKHLTINGGEFSEKSLVKLFYAIHSNKYPHLISMDLSHNITLLDPIKEANYEKTLHKLLKLNNGNLSLFETEFEEINNVVYNISSANNFKSEAISNSIFSYLLHGIAKTGKENFFNLVISEDGYDKFLFDSFKDAFKQYFIDRSPKAKSEFDICPKKLSDFKRHFGYILSEFSTKISMEVENRFPEIKNYELFAKFTINLVQKVTEEIILENQILISDEDLTKHFKVAQLLNNLKSITTVQQSDEVDFIKRPIKRKSPEERNSDPSPKRIDFGSQEKNTEATPSSKCSPSKSTTKDSPRTPT